MAGVLKGRRGAGKCCKAGNGGWSEGAHCSTGNAIAAGASLTTALTLVARRIRVTGIVQGVGFRPFVWRLARELKLTGWVRNDAQGVEIAAQGAAAQIAVLLQRLRTDAPPLARVDEVQAREAVLEDWAGFSIIDSVQGRAVTAIGPDVAVCADCLNELFDPMNRRWRHAFITCTHCGPRFTVT